MSTAAPETPGTPEGRGPADGPGPDGRDGRTAELTAAVYGLIDAARRAKSRRPHQPGQLGTAELRVLGQLRALETPAAMGAVGRGAGLSPASTTAIVDRLEAEGFVERTRDADDRRVVRIALTARGRDAVRERLEAWEASWRATLEAVPVEDLAVTSRTLRALARAVDES